MSTLLGAGVALVATIALLHVFAPVARRIGLVDHPGGRKQHERVVPLIGGIAIVCGFAFGTFLLDSPLGPYRSLFAALLLVLIVGVLDDFHELSPTARFAAQIIAALMVALWGGVRLADFGDLLGFHTPLGWASIPVTVFCVVGVINALNLVDGIDGLAASLALVLLVGVAWMGYLAGSPLTDLTIVLVGAVAGFWILNARIIESRPAPAFLGDSGSLALGLLVSYLVVAGSQGESRIMAPVTALWLFALPLLDTVYVMIRRLRRGRSPFAGGRDHIHHLFLRAGYSVRDTLALLIVFAGLLAIAGVAAERAGVSELVGFVGFLLVAIGYYLAVDRAWTTRRWLGRPVIEG